VHQRPHTHEARLDRHVDGRTSQTVVADGRRRLAQHQHLGVRRRIVTPDRLIERPRHDAAVLDEDGADRYLTRVLRETRLFKGR
jgi:hypothetical protein